jgi:general nucleoside transport system permease protein
VDLDVVVVATVARALAFATPLIWAALGEVIAERSGVVNLGVEGMMALGAVTGFAVATTTGDVGWGLAAAAGAGAAGALVHAFVAITLRADAYVSGLALTMLGLGLSGLIGRAWVGRPLADPMRVLDVPLLRDLPLLGPALFQGQHALTYGALLAAVVASVLLYRTRAGLVLRSVGENPVAVDAAGLPVRRVRYAAVLVGGLMAGIGGGYLSLAYRPSWGEGMVNGLGWIALALAIFALWDPLRVVLAGLLFAACFTLAFRLQNVFPPELLTMLPYVFTVVALLVTAWRRGGRALGAPEALGRPYLRGER